MGARGALQLRDGRDAAGMAALAPDPDRLRTGQGFAPERRPPVRGGAPVVPLGIPASGSLPRGGGVPAGDGVGTVKLSGCEL